MIRTLIATSIVISIVPASAFAKDERAAETGIPGVVKDVLSCRKILSAAERLSCFDSSGANLAQALDQRRIVVAERGEARKTRRSLFGFAVPKIALFSRNDSEPEMVAIDAGIVSVFSNPQGEYMLQLDDGALWRMMDAPRGSDPQKGDKIHIKRGALGSYFGSINGRVSVRIQRVQ